MERNDIPVGFGFALAQNPEAMDHFAALDESRRSEILRQAHAISSKTELQSLVDRLTLQ